MIVAAFSAAGSEGDRIMSDANFPDARIMQLHEYAEKLQLKDYQALNERLLPVFKGRDLGELLLSRAQLKLLACDESFIDDLEEADGLLQGPSRLPSFFAGFRPHSPNTFFLFPPSPGAVARFLTILHSSRDLFHRYCGDMGRAMAEQVESEILYFCGRFEDALALAEPAYRKFAREENYVMAIFAGYTLLRCRLATGGDACRTITQIIGWARKFPETCYPRMYDVIRVWANATTGWSGDTSRYHTMPTGTVFPALEDRADAIEHGVSRLALTEEPFAEMQRLNNNDYHTMRGFYIEIFNAMAQFKFQMKQAAQTSFHEIYETARNTGLITPLMEYGRQIVPLLRHVQEKDCEGKYDAAWLEKLIDMADQYEKRLQLFREG